MSNDPFPERVTPRKLCIRNGSINSTIPLGKFPRLSEYLDDDQGQAQVSLSFARDDSGHCVITGSVKAGMNVPCQRCLKAIRVGVESDLALKVAEDEAEAEQIASETADPQGKLEIVFCEHGQLDLLSMIEDELIMGLPIVAVHDDDQCNDLLNALKAKADQDVATGQGKVGGLDALEQLRQALQEKQQEKDK